MTLLRRNDVVTHHGRTTLQLGNEGVELPEPLAQIAVTLAARSAPDPTVAGLPQSLVCGSEWLFPGRRAGHPIAASSLRAQLTRMGIPPRSARNTALIELARDIPPAILADLLGIAPKTADRWRQLAGAGWTSYPSLRLRPAFHPALEGFR